MKLMEKFCKSSKSSTKLKKYLIITAEESSRFQINGKQSETTTCVTKTLLNHNLPYHSPKTHAQHISPTERKLPFTS